MKNGTEKNNTPNSQRKKIVINKIWYIQSACSTEKNKLINVQEFSQPYFYEHFVKGSYN